MLRRSFVVQTVLGGLKKCITLLKYIEENSYKKNNLSSTKYLKEGLTKSLSHVCYLRWALSLFPGLATRVMWPQWEQWLLSSPVRRRFRKDVITPVTNTTSSLPYGKPKPHESGLATLEAPWYRGVNPVTEQWSKYLREQTRKWDGMDAMDD